jgi:hypothetical protein
MAVCQAASKELVVDLVDFRFYEDLLTEGVPGKLKHTPVSLECRQSHYVRGSGGNSRATRLTMVLDGR